MQYNKQKKPFYGLEIYMNSTGKKSPSYEFQCSSKTLYKDTFTGKKYNIFQFGEWLNQPHIKEKIYQRWQLKMGSVDLETDTVNKYTNSNLQRKVAWYLIPPQLKNQNVDGMKPINQTVPRYTEQQMTQARPPAPDHAQPINQSDLDEMDDNLPPF